MKSFHGYLCYGWLAASCILPGCNQDHSMEGETPHPKPPKVASTSQPEEKVTPINQNSDDVSATKTDNAVTNPDDDQLEESSDRNTEPPENSTPPSQDPDNIVDGQEVYNDCSRCVERAKALSPQAGFNADISRTVNMGFYKIPPQKGLCDIHFMAHMFDRIEDHAGHDSILYQQIALYCPCDCGWRASY